MTAASSLVAAALAIGMPVFPCDAQKHPIVSGGFKAATTDPAVIERLFARRGAEMIGMPTGRASGIVVIDVDVKDGARGGEWFADHFEALPETRTHRTASGGTHLLFRAPADVEIRNSASRIAPGVDVRGEGGYVIVPPSAGYRVTCDAEPAEMPDWLIRACLRPDPEPIPAPPPRTNGPAADERAARYAEAALDGESRAVAGAQEGSRNHTLNVAAVKLGGFVAAGLLPRATVEAELLRAAMQAGLPRPEAERTIRSGLVAGMQHPREAPPERERAQEPPRANGAARPRQDERGEHLKEPPTDTYELLSLAQIVELKPPAWQVAKLFTVGSNVVLYGPWGSLKSFAVLDLGLCIAFGRPWQGREVVQGGVIYVAGEGKAGFARRVKAWKLHHGLEDGDAPFWLLHAPVNLTDPEHVAKLIRTALAAAKARGVKVALIVIDTLARAMVGADENSSQDMGKAVAAADLIRAETEATTLAVHHTGKDADRGPRGSNALSGAVDTLIRVDRAEMVLSLTVEKQKEDEEGEPIILQAQKVDLGVSPVDGEPLTSLVLVADTSGHVRAVRPSGRVSADQQQALKVLHDALAEHGEPDFPGVPAGCRSIPEAWWRDRYYSRCKPGAEPDTKQKAFRRAADALLSAGCVAMNRGRVWAP